MLSVRFEPTVSAGERVQAYALDRAATGTGVIIIIIVYIHSIYNYTPVTNHVSMVYSDAAIPWLQIMAYVMLFNMKKFCTFTVPLFEVCAQCPVRVLYVVPWWNHFPVTIMIIITAIVITFMQGIWNYISETNPRL